MKQNQVGWVFIASAIGLLAVNLSDTIGDLHAWHDASTPAFVAVIVKQVGSVLLAVLGGKMQTPFGASS